MAISGFDHRVFKGIQKMGYKQPTPIQRKAIPPIMDGKDVVGMSRTGSGKTAAFVVPMLQKLKQRDTMGCRALLLSPTRELALQTFNVVKQLGRFNGLRCACVVGGDSMEEQFAAVHEHPDILIATPGRLLHLVVEMNMKMTSIQYVVFDEADRLFEMGFMDQLQEVLKRLPDSRQTLLFSATLPKMLIDFAKAGLSEPVLVRLDVDTKISDKLSMAFITCRAGDKIPALLYLARDAVSRKEQTIVFCATMKHVEYVVAIFAEAGLDCAFLYSQMDPTARKMNIARFRNKQCSLLVVTDIAARGVDIPLLDNAINFHFPPKPKLFVHRVGRVARAGNAGSSFSLVGPDEMAYLVDLFLFLGRPLKFAGDDRVRKEDDVVIGRFPDALVHLETDFLKTIHENALEISDLKHKSENALKKYMRTRPQPSAESVRRVKSMREKELAPHPYFLKDSSVVEETSDVLQGLKNWRPSATIFELNTSGKQQPAAVMKEKRKAHQDVINGRRVSKQKSEEQPREAVAEPDPLDADADQAIVETFDEIVQVTKFNAASATSVGKKRKNDAQEKREREKKEYFVPYMPQDAHTEKALAVDKNNFDLMAKQMSVEISADDDKGLYREQHKKRWDRKAKKFVSGDDGPAVKKIRTEEGTWLPATYKSGRYESWQKKQKVQFRRDDENGDESRPRFSGKRGRGTGQRPAGRQGVRSELKNKDQIFKERKRKAKVQEFQAKRRQDKLKKKVAGAGRGKKR
ncbi:ATP-dependent RNA helicase DDX54 [Aphelenchoides avenae]|nr:ATP-dependent RNA helicase DDX54 [Aphelenchus avenae]